MNRYWISSFFSVGYFSGVLGFTNAERTVFTAQFDKLPSGDPTALYDRTEFWIVNDNAFNEQLSELDEYRFVFDRSGDIQMWRNTESGPPTKIVACADSGLKFYPFFCLNGRITALGLMGIVSSTRIAPTTANPTTTNNTAAAAADDDDSESCKICCSARANCVLVPCGHVFFCHDCRDMYEAKSKQVCPVCRRDYDDAIEIAE